MFSYRDKLQSNVQNSVGYLFGRVSRNGSYSLYRISGEYVLVVATWNHLHEFEQASGVGDGQGSLPCYSPCGHEVGHD